MNSNMEIASLTETIKAVSNDGGNKKYKKYTPEEEVRC